jgi:hypothetical protein
MTFKKLSLGFSGKRQDIYFGLKEEKKISGLCLMRYVHMDG